MQSASVYGFKISCEAARNCKLSVKNINDIGGQMQFRPWESIGNKQNRGNRRNVFSFYHTLPSSHYIPHIPRERSCVPFMFRGKVSILFFEKYKAS
jgi:hypothetical protein